MVPHRVDAGDAIMCSRTDDYETWLVHLTPKITADLGKEFDDVRYEVSVPGDSFFISNMLFVKIASKSTEEGQRNSIDVVVKRPPLLESVREMMRSDDQFHNEILFYEKFGKHYSEYPHCFYAEEKAPTDSVIVLENMVISKGYEVCENKYDLPMEYTEAAIRGIARFHANAYAMKELRREEFLEIRKNMKEVRYYPCSNMKIVLNDTATRSVEYLRGKGYDSGFCDKLESELENMYDRLILKITEPEEPLATLCHGDFTINNTLFERKNGELKATFIDFALVRYGSPVLDLSTFLCLHCAQELDKNMLNHVLRVYHETLSSCLVEHGLDCGKYTYEALLEDYKKRGLFGFFIATFFLATVMGKSDRTPEEIAEIDTSEWGPMMRECGGDEVSEILANMLLRLKDFGCLDRLL